MSAVPSELVFDPWYPPKQALATARRYHGLSPTEVTRLMEISLLRLSLLESGMAKVSQDEGLGFLGLYGIEYAESIVLSPPKPPSRSVRPKVPPATQKKPKAQFQRPKRRRQRKSRQHLAKSAEYALDARSRQHLAVIMREQPIARPCDF